MNEDKNKTEKITEKSFLENVLSLLNSNKKNILNSILLLAGTYLLWNTIGLVFDILGFVIGAFLVLFALSELKILNLKEQITIFLKFIKMK